MLILPAIDLFDHKVVRLYKGEYEKMTVYSDQPLEFAKDFYQAGAEWVHMVDLEGAKSGETPNLDVVKMVAMQSGLKVEIGGGIRNMDIIAQYFESGVSRVILGTAAVQNPSFVEEAVSKYGDKIAVGVDIKDGKVAIHGWTEVSGFDAFDFCHQMQKMGVSTIISTDISKDGAMEGTNHALYEKMQSELKLNIVASGGVSTLEDVRKLRKLNLYGAIIGKSYYSGAINLKEAVEVAK